MTADPDIARVARSIGQAARATMLTALLEGRRLPATELARRARVSAATASSHLAQLAREGLVEVETRGRHRYYALGGRDVAAALEALQRIARPAQPQSLRSATVAERLRLARTCYDHLAGRVGVDVTRALVRRRYLRARDGNFLLTGSGTRWLGELGVDVEALRERRRAFTLACLDWSERRPHLAGAVAAGLLDRMLELGWFERAHGSRALHVTDAGAAALESELGVAVSPGRARARTR